jgi:hypothetical protein
VAPWNVAHLGQKTDAMNPVFYHFHGLRLTGPNRLVLYSNYAIGRRNLWIYERYLVDFRTTISELRRVNIRPIWRPVPEKWRLLRVIWRWLHGRFAWASV